MGKDIREAFAADEFDVVCEYVLNGKKGYCAEHRTAKNVVNGRKKRAYYVEGNSYEMGYLLGYLAWDEVEKMGTTFIQNIIFAFFKENPDECWLIKFFKSILKKIIQKHLAKWIYDFSVEILKDIPYQYKLEIHGLADGYTASCKAADRKPVVDFQDLWALNVGIDCLLSFIYAPDVFIERLPKFIPRPTSGMFRVPVACNAFAVFGDATSDMANGKKVHYFGRDFMFPTAEVFQDVACHIIYNPDPSEGNRLPLVSMSAPGFAGSIMAMNKDGIAMGVDMSPAGNCDHHRAGFNSLLLVRDSIHHGTGAQQALDNVIEAQRGVSWDYIIADGKNDEAVVIEAGMHTATMDFVSYPPDELQVLGVLPGQQFLNEQQQIHQQGLMVRWHNYQYPEAFLQFNEVLFELYGKDYDPSRFGEHGYICERINGKIKNNCPYSFYFAPQRENKDDVLIMTNHYIVPAMRFCSMDPWTAEVAGSQLNDIQWRYDKLNDLILTRYGQINWDEAWKLINFLAAEPGSYVEDYYQNNPDYKYQNEQGEWCVTKQVEGSVSLCNLTTKVARSRYGYFADQPVRTTLLNYVD